jgi:hypothetical protein
MARIGGILLMNLHQGAVVVIYFLPQPGRMFKLGFHAVRYLFKQDLPSPLATGASNPVPPPAIRQILPILPVTFVPGSQLAHQVFHKSQ